MHLCFTCRLEKITCLLEKDIRILSCKREGNVRTFNASGSPLRDGADPLVPTIVMGPADVGSSLLKDGAVEPAFEVILTSAVLARGDGVIAGAGTERGTFVDFGAWLDATPVVRRRAATRRRTSVSSIFVLQCVWIKFQAYSTTKLEGVDVRSVAVAMQKT